MADFSHDDLMFAARVAGMKRGPRGGGELAAALTTPGDDGTNDLVRTLVGGMMRERELKMENQLRRQAAEEDFNRRAALEREQGERGDTRLFAELGARKSERDDDRTFSREESATAFNRGRKAAGEDYERATKDADRRADSTAYDRVVEQIAAMEQQGYDPPEVLTRHRDELAGRLGRPAATTQPAGGGGAAAPKPGSPAAIRRAAERTRAMEPLQEAVAAIQQGVSEDFSPNAPTANRARRPGHLVKLQQVAEQLAAVDPQGVGPAFQPIVDQLLAMYEGDDRSDGDLLDAINKIKRLQGYEPWNPTDFDTEWKKAHPPLRSTVMPAFGP